MSRRDVLSLYRRILKVAKEWKAASGSELETSEEQKYIADEAVKLFKKNKNLQTESEISLAIQEGESRLQLALHYGNPYPRPVNFPPMSYAQPGKKPGKVQERKRRQAKPIYIQSYDEYDKS